jgi:hypothetical protein
MFEADVWTSVLRRRGMFLSGQDHNTPNDPHEERALGGLKVDNNAIGRGARHATTGLLQRDAAQALTVSLRRSPTQWRGSTRRLLSSSRRRNNAAGRWRQLRT